MAKMRVHELAKEINIPNKDVVAYLIENGSSVKSHMSNIEDNEIEKVKRHFAKPEAPQTEKKQVSQPTPKPEQQPAGKSAETAPKPAQAEKTAGQRPQEDRQQDRKSVV